MSQLNLQGVFLHRVAEPAVFVRLNAGVTVAGSNTVRGEFRTYAAGRVRLVTRPGRSRMVEVAARRVDRPTRETLDDWAGQLLLLRDGRGRKVYGSYLEAAVVEQPGQAFCDLSFEFVGVDYVEPV